MNEDVIYQTEAHNKTPKMVAIEFGSNYFDAPRRIRWLTNSAFKLMGGNRTYSVRFVEGNHHTTINLYQIVVTARGDS